MKPNDMYRIVSIAWRRDEGGGGRNKERQQDIRRISRGILLTIGGLIAKVGDEYACYRSETVLELYIGCFICLDHPSTDPTWGGRCTSLCSPSSSFEIGD